MIADDSDDTNVLKHFILYFSFYDCTDQTNVTSVRSKIFWCWEKYFEADEL